MSASLAFANNPSHPVNTLIRERLAQVELTLAEARLKVVSSLDREIASVRLWLQALQSFDPTLTMETKVNQAPESPADPALQAFLEDPPQPAKNNIVAFNKGDFEPLEPVVEEPRVDPLLAKASIDELNEALDAAFEGLEKQDQDKK